MEMLKIPRKQIQRLKCVVYILSLILKCNVKIYIFLRKYLLLAHIFLVSTLASRKIISFSSNLFLRTSCSRPSLSLILSARFRFRIFNSSQRIHFSIFILICSRRKSLIFVGKLKRGCKSNYKCPYILFKKACPIYNETLIIFNFGFSVLQRQWKKLSEFNKDRSDDILLIVTQIYMGTVVNRIV